MKPSDSPALKEQSDWYPAKWNGLVPKRVRTTMTVRADVPPGVSRVNRLVAMAGTEFDAWVNAHGAVAVIFESGETLGVKPDEFTVIEWHEGTKL